MSFNLEDCQCQRTVRIAEPCMVIRDLPKACLQSLRLVWASYSILCVLRCNQCTNLGRRVQSALHKQWRACLGGKSCQVWGHCAVIHSSNQVPDTVAHMTKWFINRTSDVENRSTKRKSRLTELDLIKSHLRWCMQGGEGGLSSGTWGGNCQD